MSRRVVDDVRATQRLGKRRAETESEKREREEAEQKRVALEQGKKEALECGRICVVEVKKLAERDPDARSVTVYIANTDHVRADRLKARVDGAVAYLKRQGFEAEVETKYMSGAYDNARECHFDGYTNYYIAVKW